MLIRRLFLRLVGLSTTQKIVTSILINVVLGISLRGVAEWATYKYAIASNIRPPLEGIPYLAVAAVGLGLFAVLISAAIIGLTSFVFGYLGIFVNRLITVFEKLSVTGSGDEADRSSGTRKSYIRSTAGIAGSILFATAAMSAIAWARSSDTGFVYLACTNCAAALAFLNLRYLWIRWIVFLSSVFLIYLTLSVLLLNNSTYSRVLSWMKYGGNIPVQVFFKCTDVEQSITGRLVLRTDVALIVKESEHGSVEHLMASVCSISYM